MNTQVMRHAPILVPQQRGGVGQRSVKPKLVKAKRPLLVKEAKEPPIKTSPLHCKRKPRMHEEREIRDCVGAFLDNGRSLIESVELIRVYMMKMSLLRAKGVKTKAAESLGITRCHLDNYLARGKDLL